MEHTREPWQYERIPAIFNPKLDGFQIIAATPNGADVMTVALCTVGEMDEQNARRIVACVNACAGFKTEELELIAGIKSSAFKSLMKQQRDELLAAAEAVIRADEAENDHDYYRALDMLRSAIAKVKPCRQNPHYAGPSQCSMGTVGCTTQHTSQQQKEEWQIVGYLDGRGRFFYANDPLMIRDHSGMRECYALPR